MGRKSLLQNATRDDGRGFITPLVHVANASDLFFELKTGSPLRTGSAQANRTPVPNIVPQDLLEALHQRRCVPIVGPELNASPTQRRGNVLPGLRGLLERLTQIVTVPDDVSLPENERLENWTIDAQLGRLAERFEAANKWPQLLQAIRDYYAPQQPSSLHRQIASWSVPGIFYTHFDGLMEAAFAAEAHPCVTYHFSESAESTRTTHSSRETTDQSDPTLVLVRGTVNDLRSLVLSEHDHFALDEQLERISGPIKSLATSYLGRCVLFLGTTPGDRVTRKLARKLLEANNPRATESFFVSAHHSVSDELFWRRFRVTFIRQENEDVIQALNTFRMSE